MKSRWLILLLGLVLASSLAQASIAFAQSDSSTSSTTKNGPLLINCDRTTVDAQGQTTITDECTIDKFFQQFVVIAQFGLSIVSILAVLMFVFGGFQWITAGGRSSKIDEGKRIIVGTLVGITISFTAFVIINFTISAITGTAARSINPFGGLIATVFDRPDTQDLTRPFNGVTSGIDTTNDCHANWDHCTDQVYCSDPNRTSGPIRDLQTALDAKGCGCQVTGCFAEITAACVRRFQLANDLPPTGFVDTTTKNLALSLGGRSCNSTPAVIDRISKVTAALPNYDVNLVTKTSPLPATTKTGCCVVSKRNANGPYPLFCADAVSERTCIALGSDNIFVPGDTCQNSEVTNELCGFCAVPAGTGPSSGKCFQQASPTWCSDIAKPALNFSRGSCFGNGACNNNGQNSCDQSLYITP